PKGWIVTTWKGPVYMGTLIFTKILFPMIPSPNFNWWKNTGRSLPFLKKKEQKEAVIFIYARAQGRAWFFPPIPEECKKVIYQGNSSTPIRTSCFTTVHMTK